MYLREPERFAAKARDWSIEFAHAPQHTLWSQKNMHNPQLQSRPAKQQVDEKQQMAKWVVHTLEWTSTDELQIPRLQQGPD